jgi:flagellar biogenesis protein FliO
LTVSGKVALFAIAVTSHFRLVLPLTTLILLLVLLFWAFVKIGEVYSFRSIVSTARVVEI